MIQTRVVALRCQSLVVTSVDQSAAGAVTLCGAFFFQGRTQIEHTEVEISDVMQH